MSIGRWALSELSDFFCLTSWAALMVQGGMVGWGEASKTTGGGVH